MKKILTILLVCLFTITLTGCGNTDKEKIDDVIDDVNNKTEEKTNENEVKLYSDDTKVVFNMQDIYYIVYYHDGENITGLDYVYSYPDADTAKYTETILRASFNDDSNVNKVERHGKQIIINFKEDAYYGTTLEEIRNQYSMLEEMINN